MMKPSTALVVAFIAATAQFAAPAAFSQKKECPTDQPNCDMKFGPKDLPEPNGGASLVPAQANPMGVPPVATSAANMTLTDAQAKSWIDKSVYSSDNKKIGEVAAFARDAAGNVTEMHADIGGFLGMGETRVRLMPAQFKIGADRIDLNVTAEQAKTLPILKK